MVVRISKIWKGIQRKKTILDELKTLFRIRTSLSISHTSRMISMLKVNSKKLQTIKLMSLEKPFMNLMNLKKLPLNQNIKKKKRSSPQPPNLSRSKRSMRETRLFDHRKRLSSVLNTTQRPLRRSRLLIMLTLSLT